MRMAGNLENEMVVLESMAREKVELKGMEKVKVQKRGIESRVVHIVENFLEMKKQKTLRRTVELNH